MPILYNPNKSARSIILQDGSMRNIGGKKNFYVKPEELSGQILGLLKSGKLFDKGGDPIVMPEVVVSAPVALVSGPKGGGVIITITADSTSSDIHQEYVIDNDIKDLSNQKSEVSPPVSDDVTEEPVKSKKKKKKDLEE